MRADFLTRFKSKIKPETKELIQMMKSEGKEYPDIYYEVMKLQPEVSAQTISNWIKQN